MTYTIEDSISEARWKARNRRTEQLIVRFRREDGTARYRSVASLTGIIKTVRVGETGLLILRVEPDGWVRSCAKEFDSHPFNRSSVNPTPQQSLPPAEQSKA